MSLFQIIYIPVSPRIDETEPAVGGRRHGAEAARPGPRRAPAGRGRRERDATAAAGSGETGDDD